ncbi:MAG TPA: CHAT domain-containing protein, partial [Cyclobacteriaceae bacterium]|nr:CHAT domain-containing protein [Cyclobacteriaceae bacterium]
NYQDAKVFLLNAKEVLEKTIGKNHPNYIMVLSNLALAYELSNDDKTAEKYYNDCLILVKKQLDKIFPALSDLEKKKYYDNLIPLFQNYGNFVLNSYTHDNGGKRIGDWYNWRIETKGLLFHASTQLRQRILGSGDPQLISKFTTWQSLRDTLAKSYQRPNAESNKNILKLEEQTSQIEKEMSRYSEAFKKIAESKAYSWKDVQKQLKPGEAAIEMIRMEERTKDEDDGHYDYDPVYVALIIRSDTKLNPELLILPYADKMEGEYFKQYKNSIRYDVRDTVSFRVFWKPVANKLSGINKVYFSADGVYHLINLATLNNPGKVTTTKPNAYLLDEIDIEIVLSTKDLITGPKNPDALDKVILFGFPNYNNAKPSVPVSTDRGLQLAMPTTRELKADTSQRFFNGDNIAELPGTRKEVENIQQLLKSKSVNHDAYLFDKASEAEIKRVRNPSVLHIATHGYFLGDEVMSKNNLSAVSSSSNPLMRSGLLFSGAKYAFQSEAAVSGEDGVLTSLEATGLRLDQTRLVVLSACETGLGVISNGEGVYGLQRSFQLAGAKAVLMSLWTVPDEATQELMTEFYSQWLEGISPRESLKKAQSKVRIKHPDPHDWGGFVLIGN